MPPAPRPLREERLTLAGVPALATYAESVGSAERAAARGTVLVLHGLTAAKESQHLDARSLAEQGYLAVAIDAVGHGDRRYPDFEERFSAARGEQSFYAAVAQTAAELPAAIAALEERGWAPPGKLGAVGFSMGGFILFGALVARCRLDAVATIVAAPTWLPEAQSPHRQLDRFFPTPLLMITGSADETVSPAPARELYEALGPRYLAAPERLHLLEAPGEGHMFSPPAWDLAWGQVCGWFDRFLVGAS
jgi:dienelactone hydrolase